jgi:hypothetical protein
MLAGIREGVMIEISEETARELIEALNGLVSNKHLDVPTHSINGDEIKDIHQLSEIMGVPEVIAAKAVLEHPDNKLQDEAKEILRVRTPAGAQKYGQPIGTIIRRDIRLPSLSTSHSPTSAARRTPKLVAQPKADDKVSFLGSRHKRWHLTPRGTFVGRVGRGGGDNGGGGGADGLGGGMFGGFGGLGGLDFLKGKKLPTGSRKIGESYRFFPDGSRGKASRYVTKLKNGEVETWLVLGRYSPSGKLVREQMAKVKPGESSDKVWGSIIRAFKPKGKK